MPGPHRNMPPALWFHPYKAEANKLRQAELERRLAALQTLSFDALIKAIHETHMPLLTTELERRIKLLAAQKAIAIPPRQAYMKQIGLQPSWVVVGTVDLYAIHNREFEDPSEAYLSFVQFVGQSSPFAPGVFTPLAALVRRLPSPICHPVMTALLLLYRALVITKMTPRRSGVRAIKKIRYTYPDPPNFGILADAVWDKIMSFDPENREQVDRVQFQIRLVFTDLPVQKRNELSDRLDALD